MIMDKRTPWALLSLFLLMIPVSCRGEGDVRSGGEFPPGTGEIYLYGETHGVRKILDRELELWRDYYGNRGMRHLFVELPYYTAEYLNLWMKASDDAILDGIFEEARGTASDNPDVRAFYRGIKEFCPETIFHGTDVGHQYGTTGERFLAGLERGGQENSETYRLALEAVGQGRRYYLPEKDPLYRENTMVENFIREFDRLGTESVMGIYGSAHTGLESRDFTGTIPCMANQLRRRYGAAIHSESLTFLAKDIGPLRTDVVVLGGREYRASYFGRQTLDGFKDFSYRDFWRLEGAYDDFAESPLTGDVLPYRNFPMLIETGQVFLIEYGKTDGSRIRLPYRSDGHIWNDMPTTEGFTAE